MPIVFWENQIKRYWQKSIFTIYFDIIRKYFIIFSYFLFCTMNQKQIVAFFAGSQDIQDEAVREKTKTEVEAFLEANKDQISKIIYGGWVYGVMWIILEASKKVGITIEGYSIERYRKYDEGKGVDITFFADDYERLKEFTKNADVFVALPGWLGTIKEILGVKDHILEGNTQKQIFVSSLFQAFYAMIQELTQSQMIYGKDAEVLNSVWSLETIRI